MARSSPPVSPAEGRREILECDSEDGEFWQVFLARLTGHHRGLNANADRALCGIASQHYRMHFTRNLLARVPRNHQHIASAVLKTIFAPNTKLGSALNRPGFLGGLVYWFPTVWLGCRAA